MFWLSNEFVWRVGQDATVGCYNIAYFSCLMSNVNILSSLDRHCWEPQIMGCSFDRWGSW